MLSWTCSQEYKWTWTHWHWFQLTWTVETSPLKLRPIFDTQKPEERLLCLTYRLNHSNRAKDPGISNKTFKLSNGAQSLWPSWWERSATDKGDKLCSFWHLIQTQIIVHSIKSAQYPMVVSLKPKACLAVLWGGGRGLGGGGRTGGGAGGGGLELRTEQNPLSSHAWRTCI